MLSQAVTNYIESHTEPIKSMLYEMRSIILEVAPDAEESLSYKVPCYKHNGMLVAFGARKSGCSFYGVNIALLQKLATEVKNIKHSGSTLLIDTNQKIPKTLIKKIVKIRLQENAARKASKQQHKK